MFVGDKPAFPDAGVFAAALISPITDTCLKACPRRWCSTTAGIVQLCASAASAQMQPDRGNAGTNHCAHMRSKVLPRARSTRKLCCCVQNGTPRCVPTTRACYWRRDAPRLRRALLFSSYGARFATCMCPCSLYCGLNRRIPSANPSNWLQGLCWLARVFCDGVIKI